MGNQETLAGPGKRGAKEEAGAVARLQEHEGGAFVIKEYEAGARGRCAGENY